MVSREQPLRLPSWGHLLFLKVPGLDVVIVMMRNSISSFRDVWINDRANNQVVQGAERNVIETGRKEGMDSSLIIQKISMERDFSNSEEINNSRFK